MVALLLRLHRIGAEELWLDEAFSFHDVTVAGWLDALRFKDVPPLYPLLLRGWMGLAGDSEFALRLVPEPAGRVRPCVVYSLGTTLLPVVLLLS